MDKSCLCLTLPPFAGRGKIFPGEYGCVGLFPSVAGTIFPGEYGCIFVQYGCVGLFPSVASRDKLFPVEYGCTSLFPVRSLQGRFHCFQWNIDFFFHGTFFWYDCCSPLTVPFPRYGYCRQESCSVWNKFWKNAAYYNWLWRWNNKHKAFNLIEWLRMCCFVWEQDSF